MGYSTVGEPEEISKENKLDIDDFIPIKCMSMLEKIPVVKRNFIVHPVEYDRFLKTDLKLHLGFINIDCPY